MNVMRKFNRPTYVSVCSDFDFVFDRRPRGAQAGTWQLWMDFDNLFMATHWAYLSRLALRMPQGQF